MQRREFLKCGAAAGLGITLHASGALDAAPGLLQTREAEANVSDPVIISTWRFGVPANARAMETLRGGGSVIDAVERGVMVTEADPEVSSVGRGGRPNRDGVVEVDAAIMEGTHLEAGSVAGVQDILHPVAVARLVMEKTRHVMLVGNGAREFALAHGHEAVDLLTDAARKDWHQWREGTREKAEKPEDDHDTIGMVALAGGKVAASCTTSGMAWKLPGRVGDSPLIGHGLYCDDAAGGAVATGVGEEIIKVCGSYQVVEFMRQGRSPSEAIAAVLERVLARDPDNRQAVAFVAVRADGEVGYGSTTEGFQAAVHRGDEATLVDAPVVGE